MLNKIFNFLQFMMHIWAFQSIFKYGRDWLTTHQWPINITGLILRILDNSFYLGICTYVGTVLWNLILICSIVDTAIEIQKKWRLESQKGKKLKIERSYHLLTTWQNSVPSTNLGKAIFFSYQCIRVQLYGLAIKNIKIPDSLKFTN